MLKFFERLTSVSNISAETAATQKLKEISEKMKIVNFLHLLFTVVRKPPKSQSPVIVIGTVFLGRIK
jgi:hypothetical protein